MNALRTLRRNLFPTAAELHADAVEVFLGRGLSPADAEWAAHELWLCCRLGRPTSPRIRDLLEEGSA